MITATNVGSFRASPVDFVVVELGEDGAVYCPEHLPDLDDWPPRTPVRVHVPPQHAYPACDECGVEV